MCGKKVRAVKLDEFLCESVVDVIKLDIEGHEVHALRGMRDLIRRSRPVIFSELAPMNLRNAGQSAEELLAYFVDLGYEINMIEKTGSLFHFGKDCVALLAAHEASGCHHSDLLLLPHVVSL